MLLILLEKKWQTLKNDNNRWNETQFFISLSSVQKVLSRFSQNWHSQINMEIKQTHE
jgi:hypothetical protein